MTLSKNLETIQEQLRNTSCKLVAVSKTYPSETILEAYQLGQRIFGENKVQELVSKAEVLPKDIEWHQIGHLQSNKVRQIVPFVSLIHAVDSFKLLQAIDKEAARINRVVSCLLQIHIAKEESKFGLSEEEAASIIYGDELTTLKNIQVKGLMGMATNTENKITIREEFKGLKRFFDKLKASALPDQVELKELSMGMSGDYLIAMEEGSTLVRIGSALFGKRTYV